MDSTRMHAGGGLARRAIAIAATIAIVAAGVAVAPSAAHAADGLATISGVVTGAGVGPLAGIDITMTSSTGEDVDDATTADDGSYSLPDNLPGTYTLSFDDDDREDNGGYFASATKIIILAGADKTVSLTLAVRPHFTVSGKASTQSGSTPPDTYTASIQIPDPDTAGAWLEVDSVDTDSGAYSFSVVAGTYRVALGVDLHYSTAIVGPFTVSANVSGKNGTIHAVATHLITGLITGVGDPTAASVEAFQLSDGVWTSANTGDIAANGTYKLEVQSGSYRVMFSAEQDGYLDQVYNGVNVTGDVDSATGATLVVVGTKDVGAINAALVRTPHLTGTVTQVGGATVASVVVSLYEWNGRGWDVEDSATTGANGAYDFSDIDVDGYYTLGYDVSQGADTTGTSTYLNGTKTLPTSTSDTSVVHVGLVTIARSFQLVDAPPVGGTVVTATGSPLAGARVEVLRRVDATWAHYADRTTDSAGRYSVILRGGGVYSVRASLPRYVTSYLGDTVALGAPVSANSLTYATDAAASFAPVHLAASATGIVSPIEDLSYCDSSVLPLGTSSANPTSVPLGFVANFYGKGYSTGYLSTNGVLYFGAARTDTTPDLAALTIPAIAPFGSATSTYEDGSPRYGYVSYGTNGTQFCAIWHGVSSASGGSAATVNTYQLLLTTRSGAIGRGDGDFDITMHYGALAWDNAGAVQAGWTGGTGKARTVLSGSGTANALLAGTRSLSRATYTYSINNIVAGTVLLTTKPATITGGTAVGSTLTVSTDAWEPAPVDLDYQWLRDGVPIIGQTGATYRTTADDQGSTISARVTGSRSGYADASVVSNGIGVPLGTLTTGAVAIGGVTVFGAVLTAVATAWGPAPVTRTFHWLRDGVDTGVTTATYPLTAADGGHKLVLVIDGSKSRYADASITSNTISVPLAIMTLGAPVIKGTPRVGSVLTAAVPAPAVPGASVALQWTRDGAAIAGANDTTYVPSAADAGAVIGLVSHASAVGYETASASATPTPAVLKFFSITSTPTIKGTAQVGKSLAASVSGWKPTAVLLYQWRAGGKPIAKATQRTLVITKALQGKKISVTVTGIRAGYLSVKATSKSVRATARPARH